MSPDPVGRPSPGSAWPVAKSLCYPCCEALINTHHEGAFVGYIVLSELRTDCARVHISSHLHLRIYLRPGRQGASSLHGLPFVGVCQTGPDRVSGGIPTDLSASNHVFTLDEAAGVLPRRDVLEDDVVSYGSKERNPIPDEYWDASNDEALNEPSLKKVLNSDPAVNVKVPEAARIKLRHDFGGSPRHMLDDSPSRSGGERFSAEHENGLLAVGPRVKGQDCLEGLAPDD